MNTDEQQVLRHIDRAIGGWVRENKTTSEAVAKALDISTGSLSSKRNGKTSWRLCELLALSKLFECTVEELLN
jgi:DNA-binding XRE family transcriptional regulator